MRRRLGEAGELVADGEASRHGEHKEVGRDDGEQWRPAEWCSAWHQEHEWSWASRSSGRPRSWPSGCITLAVPLRAVPAITVVGCRVAPFRFGRPIGSGEQWLRTCPAEPVPGRFLTQRGWRDPFDPLAAEDPSGAAVVVVLGQEGSGPAGGRRPPGDDGGLLVEGVAGFGDDFMLGRAAPTPLPEHGLDDVRRVGPAPRPPRPGPLRRAHVGHDAWVLRLQLATVAASATSVYPGVPSRWHRFDRRSACSVCAT